MPYMAQNQSLFGVPGAPPAPRQPIDIPGAIDALTSGATSLIHGALLRKQAENEMQLRSAEANRANAQVDIERQREAREANAQQADLAFRQQTERHRFIEAGGIPAHDEIQPVGTQTPIAPMNNAQPSQPSPIASAMQSGGMPGIQVTPSAAPAPSASSATVYHNEVKETPESFDPTRGAAYARGQMVGQLRNDGWATRDEIRGEQQQDRLKSLQKGREYMAGAAQDLARLKAKLATANGGVAKAMTGNQLEKAREHAAEGLIDSTGGSYDDAVNLLQNTAQGKELRDMGVKPEHLMYAHAQFSKTTTGQAIRLQSGALGMEPSEAVGAVNTTRKLVGGGAAAKTSDAATPAAAPTKAPAKAPPAAAAPKAAPKADTSSSGDNFTDDEVLEAYGAGKKSDKDIATYIKAQRAKKSARGGN